MTFLIIAIILSTSCHSKHYLGFAHQQSCKQEETAGAFLRSHSFKVKMQQNLNFIIYLFLVKSFELF